MPTNWHNGNMKIRCGAKITNQYWGIDIKKGGNVKLVETSQVADIRKRKGAELLKSRIVNSGNKFTVSEFSRRFPFLSERLSSFLSALSCDDFVFVFFDGSRYQVSFRRSDNV